MSTPVEELTAAPEPERRHCQYSGGSDMARPLVFAPWPGSRRLQREPINYNDPLLDDASWLRAGERRYEELIRNHYGSPDTIAGGGSQRHRLNKLGQLAPDIDVSGVFWS